MVRGVWHVPGLVDGGLGETERRWSKPTDSWICERHIPQLFLFQTRLAITSHV